MAPKEIALVGPWPDNYQCADFAVVGTSTGNLELFGFEPHRVTFLPLKSSMAHIAAACGLFPSVSQARRNGWDSPIPPGFSQFGGTKANPILISILNLPE